MEDQAVLDFNYANQTTELKAFSRYTGQPVMREYDMLVNTVAEPFHDGLSVLEDINVMLASWGWKPLGVDDWHGTNRTGWAAQLYPKD